MSSPENPQDAQLRIEADRVADSDEEIAASLAAGSDIHDSLAAFSEAVPRDERIDPQSRGDYRAPQFLTKTASAVERESLEEILVDLWKKSLRLPGKKRVKETRYFFNNARVLAIIAAEREVELKDDVVAVLFRDADTASAGRGEWEEKRRSMLDGFAEAGFSRGVPMIPKPHPRRGWFAHGRRTRISVAAH